MFATKKQKKINAFENVKVLSTKDIYEKLGPRVPQMKHTDGVVVFGRRKLDQVALGSDLANQSMYDQEIEAQKQTQEQQNQEQEEETPDQESDQE